MLEQHLEGELLDIAAVQEQEEDALLAKDNVVGVAIGNKFTDEQDTGVTSVTVFAAQKLPPELLKADDMVPEKLGDFDTDVIETGEIFAGGSGGEEKISAEIETELEVQALRTRRRPAMGGYSVGHYKITAGTIATGAYDSSPFPSITP
jgi:hypothetical protein